MMFTPLELLNLYLSDGKSVGPTESKLYQKFNRELSWDALLNEGYQQDLAPMLYYIITKTLVLTTQSSDLRPQSFDVSEEIKSKLKDLYNYYLVRNMIQFKELDTILDAFEKEGIDVIPLKGAYLARHYYPDPALRPMGDLDLLVRKEDMGRAKECLLSFGFEFMDGKLIEEDTWEKEHFHIPYIKHNVIISTVVELHKDIRGRLDFINSNIFEFWEHALPINKHYKHILTIPKEYLLLHIFWHTYLSIPRNYIRLIWLMDIVNIMKRDPSNIDWVFIEDKASEWGIHKHVYFCLSLTTQLLHFDFNENIMKILMPSQYSIKLFELMILKNEIKLQTSENLNLVLMIALNLISLNSFHKRIQYFLRYESKKLVSKRERIQSKYNTSSKTTFYFLYIWETLKFVLKVFKGARAILCTSHNTNKNKLKTTNSSSI